MIRSAVILGSTLRFVAKMHYIATSAQRPQPESTMRTLVLFLLAMLSSAQLAHAQEREWIRDAADEDAFLVFGVPETDDVGVSFWCKIGSGKVKLFFPEGSASLTPNTQSEFTVTIAGKDHHFKGTTSANDMTGATSIETELPVDDPVFASFQSADRFAAHIGDHSTTYPLVDAGLDNLLRLCRTK